MTDRDIPTPHRPVLGALGVLVVAALLSGCAHRITVDPIRVEPIHLTVDVRLKVDRELDDFFDFEDETAPPANVPAREGEQGAPS